MTPTERPEAKWQQVWSAWITLDEDIPEDQADANQDAMEAYRPLICLAYGHHFIPDQCGIPEHDYCVVCGVGRPAAGSVGVSDKEAGNE